LHINLTIVLHIALKIAQSLCNSNSRPNYRLSMYIRPAQFSWEKLDKLYSVDILGQNTSECQFFHIMDII